MQFGAKEIGMIIGVILFAVVVFGGLFYLASMETSEGGDGAVVATGRDEVPAMLKSIAAAEIAYAEAFSEGYIAASAAPRAPHAVNGTLTPWDLKMSKGFRRLSWSPGTDAGLLGSYEVATTDKGFVVKGTCDADGDGKRARFELTCDHPPAEAEKCKDVEAKMLTEDSVR